MFLYTSRSICKERLCFLNTNTSREGRETGTKFGFMPCVGQPSYIPVSAF